MQAVLKSKLAVNKTMSLVGRLESSCGYPDAKQRTKWVKNTIEEYWGILELVCCFIKFWLGSFASFFFFDVRFTFLFNIADAVDHC